MALTTDPIYYQGKGKSRGIHLLPHLPLCVFMVGYRVNFTVLLLLTKKINTKVLQKYTINSEIIHISVKTSKYCSKSK
jgi:hypothetical protein